MTKRTTAWLAWAILTSVALSTRGYSSLVQPPQATKPTGTASEITVRLSAAQARNFDETLVALSTQAGVAFVAEGRPLRPMLSSTDAADVTGGNSVPLSQAVGKAAAAYDYDVLRRGSIFVLTKRYTDPRDLPAVTIGECLAALADVERVMAAFNPRVPTTFDTTSSDALIADLAPTLTPDQLRMMEAKQLPLSLLSPVQKQAVRRFSLYLFVQQPAEAAKNALYGVKQATKAAFGFGYVSGKSVFGYEAPDPHGRIVFHSLENEPFRELDSTGVTEIAGPSAPLPNPNISVDASNATATLGTLVAALNARSRDGGSEMIFKVDAILAAKPVTVIGAQTMPPAQVLSALAETYGLQARTDTERNEARLMRRAGRLPQSAAGIADAVRRALPVPLLRAAQIISTAEQEAPPPPPQQPTDAPPLTPEEWQRLGEEYGRKMEAYQKRQRERAARQRPAALRHEAVRRLRLAVELEQKTNVATRFPLSRLGELERAAFAIALMTDFLTRVRVDFGQGTPPYIARFDELMLGGGPYTDEKGVPKFGMHLLSPSNGGFGPGIMNMQYSPR